MSGPSWNPGLYQSSHSYVWELGLDLIELLAPQPSEFILDVGCGTGSLTAEIAKPGARVIGIDSSAEMITQARANHPDLEFHLFDVRALDWHNQFDAVFSNAALHWVKEAEAAVASISRSLKPGGRFVAEFGGHGNIRTVRDIVYRVLRTLGVASPETLDPWYFPTAEEYKMLLERHGFVVHSITLFDRPTALKDGAQGLANWLAMFAGAFTAGLSDDQRSRFLTLAEAQATPLLLRDGVWTVDYRRLRVVAQSGAVSR